MLALPSIKAATVTVVPLANEMSATVPQTPPPVLGTEIRASPGFRFKARSLSPAVSSLFLAESVPSVRSEGGCQANRPITISGNTKIEDPDIATPLRLLLSKLPYYRHKCRVRATLEGRLAARFARREKPKRACRFISKTDAAVHRPENAHHSAMLCHSEHRPPKASHQDACRGASPNPARPPRRLRPEGHRPRGRRRRPRARVLTSGSTAAMLSAWTAGPSSSTAKPTRHWLARSWQARASSRCSSRTSGDAPRPPTSSRPPPGSGSPRTPWTPSKHRSARGVRARRPPRTCDPLRHLVCRRLPARDLA